MSPAMSNAAATLTAEAEHILTMLCDLLDRETDAVRVANFKVFRALQTDKHAMLVRYKSLVETLSRQKAILKDADDTLKERLDKTFARFNKSAAANAAALERGKASIQRVSDRIVRCVRETVYADRQSYDKRGKASGAIAKPLNIKLNEVL